MLVAREGKAIVEATGGVYEWCRITFFIEIIGVIEFIVRGIYSWGRYCYPLHGAVHEMGVMRVGLQVLRDVFLNKHVNWQNYWQHKYAIRVFSGVFCLTTMDAIVLERLCVSL